MNKSAARGRIAATPNPIPRTHPPTYKPTTLTWTTGNTTAVEVRLGAPDGPLVSRSGALGSARIGTWLQHETTFYLQNVEGGKPLTAEHTLDSVTLRPQPSPGGVRWGDL